MIMRVLVDGVLCDGGGVTPRGWAWFRNVDGLGSVRGAGTTHIGSSASKTTTDIAVVATGVRLDTVQMYTRALLTSELVGNARAALHA